MMAACAKGRLSALRALAAALAALALACACASAALAEPMDAAGDGAAAETEGALAADGAQAGEGGSAEGVAASDGSGTGGAAFDAVALSPDIYRLVGQRMPHQGGMPAESVGGVFPSMLSLGAFPASISTGVECTMNEFCGIDPCTCGKPDAWGHCACGGFKETTPDIAISVSDESVASVAELFGMRWIVPHAAGTTDVVITASLPHFQTATYAFQLTVQPFGALDALFVAAAVALAVLWLH